MVLYHTLQAEWRYQFGSDYFGVKGCYSPDTKIAYIEAEFTKLAALHEYGHMVDHLLLGEEISALRLWRDEKYMESVADKNTWIIESECGHILPAEPIQSQIFAEGFEWYYDSLETRNDLAFECRPLYELM